MKILYLLAENKHPYLFGFLELLVDSFETLWYFHDLSILEFPAKKMEESDGRQLWLTVSLGCHAIDYGILHFRSECEHLLCLLQILKSFISVATTKCICKTYYLLLLKRVSFLAFQMYQRVVKIIWSSSSVVLEVISEVKLSCTPSCSCGRDDVINGGEAENQTALAKVQWKKRWVIF